MLEAVYFVGQGGESGVYFFGQGVDLGVYLLGQGGDSGLKTTEAVCKILDVFC